METDGLLVMEVHLICIDHSFKSQNAPVPYPTIHHSEQNVLNGVLGDMEQLHCRNCEIGLLTHRYKIMYMFYFLGHHFLYCGCVYE